MKNIAKKIGIALAFMVVVALPAYALGIYGSMQVVGTIYITEQAEADGDVGGDGQLWINTASPNELMFTDDVGTDVRVALPPAYSSLWYHDGEATTTISTQNIFTQITTFVNEGAEDGNGNVVGDATTDDDLVIGTNGAGVYNINLQASFRNDGGATDDMLLTAGVTLATPIAIASSTNATPIVVTTSSAHGLKTGDMVANSGHATNTAVNTDAIITVLSPTTFELADLGGTDIAGVGVGSGGNVDIVYIGDMPIHMVASQTTLGRGASGGTFALAVGDIIEAYAANLTDTDNFVTVAIQLGLERFDE